MENTLTIALEDYDFLRHELKEKDDLCNSLEKQLRDLEKQLKDIVSEKSAKKQTVICQTICVSPIDDSTLWVNYEVLNSKDAVKRVEDLNKDTIDSLEQAVEDMAKERDALKKDKDCYAERLLAAENELCNLKSRNWWQRLWNKSK